jgi:glycerol-3-phosphate cytidylyltransferase-like family protein
MRFHKTIKARFVPNVSCIQGIFDPLRYEDIENIIKAKKYGHYLIVIVNDDPYSFLSLEEKVKIMKSIRYVNKVVKSSQSIIETMKQINPPPKYFCLLPNQELTPEEEEYFKQHDIKVNKLF